MGNERRRKNLNGKEGPPEEARSKWKDILFRNSLHVIHTGDNFIEIIIQTLLISYQTFGWSTY